MSAVAVAVAVVVVLIHPACVLVLPVFGVVFLAVNVMGATFIGLESLVQCARACWVSNER